MQTPKSIYEIRNEAILYTGIIRNAIKSGTCKPENITALNRIIQNLKTSRPVFLSTGEQALVDNLIFFHANQLRLAYRIINNSS